MLLSRYLRGLRHWLGRHSLWFEYTGLALVIMLPLLRPGYILALDMPWGPHRPATDIFSNTWALNGLLGLDGHVIPGWAVQKLVLLAIFVLGGVGMHRLMRLGRPSALAAYAGGLLYALNPFVYTRFVTGQWLVLAGWALLPWAIVAIWQLLRTPSWRRAWPAGTWLAAIGLTSVHTAAMLSFVVPVLICFGISRRQWKRTVLWLAAALGLAVLANGMWLYGALSGQGKLDASIAGFGAAQQQAFASQGTIIGSVPLTTAALQGFWADPQHRYILPSEGSRLWAIAAAAIGVVIIVGWWRILKRRDRLGMALVGLGLIGWILAMGTAWGPSDSVTESLNRLIPFYAGFREPQKWLMILVVAYAYGFGSGLFAVRAYLGRKAVRIRPLAPALLLLPLITGGLLLFGAQGQLRAATYPAGWAATEQLVAARPAGQAVIVLPWHMYLPLSFAGRTVANPAKHYLTGYVISGTDPEIRGVPADTSNPLAVQAAALAERRDTSVLRRGQVAYLILLKEDDWRRYAWLDTLPELRLVSDTATTRTYAVRSTL